MLLLASANRDPEQFVEPDACSLDRRPNRHLAFGYGIHRSIRADLARLELRVACEECPPDNWVSLAGTPTRTTFVHGVSPTCLSLFDDVSSRARRGLDSLARRRRGPVGVHARLREGCPVARSERWGGFWSLMRHEDVIAAALDTETFISGEKTTIPDSTGPAGRRGRR